LINVLGICGSPVRDSSTEILVQQVLKGATSKGALTDIIFLNDLEIKPCQACGESPEEEYCFFHDDMDEVYRKFDWCDAIVVGSPVYFDSVSAQTKLFIDRSNCFRSLDIEGPDYFIPRITKRRKGAIVLVGGEGREYEFARRVIGGFFVWAGVKSIGMVTYGHSDFDKGSVVDYPDILEQAARMGIKLTD
jgi:multimeric flavodoxin WrbA